MSETFFKKLESKIGNCHLHGYYETFNNEQEHGLILKVYENKKIVNIWACRSKNSERIMVILGDEDNITKNNIFDNKAHYNAKYFEYSDYDSAVGYVYNYLKFFFKDKVEVEKHFSFDTYCSIEEMREIKNNVKNINYQDYYELATFTDKNENYLCTYAINFEKIGLVFYKKEKDEYKELSFEEFDANLENEVTLMLGMKEKLNKFIDANLEYKIMMDADIKI